MKFKPLFLIILLIASVACKNEESWKLTGEIEGAKDATVVLESSFNGRWYAVDSTRTNGSGKFSFKQPAIEHPAIFCLDFNGEKAYIPVDSAENLVFAATAASFGKSYSVSGSQSAETLTEVNRSIAQAGASAPHDQQLKRRLGEMIISNPAGIMAYYIINSTTATGQAVFSPDDRADLRIIGAVANAYTEQRPDDPRTQYLKSLYLSHLQQQRHPVEVIDTLVATEITFPEIVLLDKEGKERSLSETANGHPVLVNFTVYSAEYSPALNIVLGDLYNEYSPRGLEIYQIGFDADEFQWRSTARNLPWITVYNSLKDGSRYLASYNVGSLPATFLIDAQGQLVERIDNPAAISDAVKKHL